MTTHRSDEGSHWEGLTLISIEVLVDVLSEPIQLERQVARRRFGERALGFDEALRFLETMGAVEVDGGYIGRDRVSTGMVAALGTGREEFCTHVIKAVLESDTGYGRELRTVCHAFVLEDGRFRMKWGRIGEEYYAARNVLLEGGAIQLQHSTGIYSVSTWFHSDFIRAIHSRGPSPEQLKVRKRNQADIGLAAELEVVTFERCTVGDRDANMVIHIAMENSAAGYDIASVRRDTSTDEVRVRLIEVKAVSPTDWAFIFTRNEVQTATENGSSYFLYLVPVRNGKPQVGEKRVIENPVEELIKEDAWRIEQGDWNVSERECHE
ncbi:MAG: DUF3883 domain-containing protein [Rhodospirillales bacterium]|nr:DUF3883 domain-containing protein [Rhodospirillales bacterium]